MIDAAPIIGCSSYEPMIGSDGQLGSSSAWHWPAVICWGICVVLFSRSITNWLLRSRDGCHVVALIELCHVLFHSISSQSEFYAALGVPGALSVSTSRASSSQCRESVVAVILRYRAGGLSPTSEVGEAGPEEEDEWLRPSKHPPITPSRLHSTKISAYCG